MTHRPRSLETEQSLTGGGGRYPAARHWPSDIKPGGGMIDVPVKPGLGCALKEPPHVCTVGGGGYDKRPKVRPGGAGG